MLRGVVEHVRSVGLQGFDVDVVASGGMWDVGWPKAWAHVRHLALSVA